MMMVSSAPNLTTSVKGRVKKFSVNFLKFGLFAGTIFLLYFPILFITFQAFNADQTGLTFGGFTLKWFRKMFTHTELVEAIKNTISIAILSTTISTILGTLFAIGINSLSTKRRRQMILINNIPVLNAEIVTAVFLMLFFSLIQALIPNIPVFGYFTLLFAHVFFSIPYVVLSVLPKLNEIDPNLFDAAQDLGCTRSKALLKVIVPSIKAGIFTGALIAFTMSIDDFVISYLTTGQGVQNFSIWIYTNIGKNVSRNNIIPIGYAYNTLISIGTLLGLTIYNLITSSKRRLTKPKNNNY
ncbi:MAG: ABC transporter permease [Acholeplasmataceae bacterium]|nr:ABC transporter permease [Acholeplasmataceae bacterium]